MHIVYHTVLKSAQNRERERDRERKNKARQSEH